MTKEGDVRSLVRKARRGDRAAFEEVVALHRSRLKAVIESRLGEPLRGRLEADDVLQETLLRAWKGIRRFEWQDEGSFFRWLNGIAVRVILDLAGKEKIRGARALDFEIPGQEVSPGRALQRKERFERLKKALDLLGPDHRKVLLFVWVDGLSVSEIARRMGRTPNAVSHLIIRALRKLRETFGDTESLGLPGLSLKHSGKSHGK